MKNKKIISALLVLTVLLNVSSITNTVEAQGQQRGTPPGMELPDGWEDMTEAEQKAYMDENKPKDANDTDRENGQKGGNRQMGTPPDVDLPDDWDDMTEVEKQAYMEENKPEDDDNTKKMNKQTNNQTTSSTARKAKNYTKFTGTLLTKKTFTDSDEIENDEAVSFLQQRGILGGYADGSFGAKKSINRAESLKVLLEALGEEAGDTTTSQFSDVPTGAWFTGYVNKGKELGIVKGYEDGTFQPGKTVNQVELLKIAFESFGIDLSDYAATSLPSGADTNAWYAKYLQYALDNDLLDVNDINLSDGMNREAFSELVYRLIKQQEAL